MKEKKITKRELFLLKEYTSIADEDFEKLYTTYGLASEKRWKDFIYWALLVCGIGFSVSGIVFFFAFNWDYMPVAVKFSVVGLAIVCSGYIAVTPRVKERVNKVSLVATSILIGVLLAVFGQTYQTGANAYDLFLTWLVVVIPLTLVSQSTYQWLFFSVLANTTLILACVQRLQVDSVFVGIILVVLTNVVLLFVPSWKLFYRNVRIGNLYTQIQTAAIYLLATIGFGCWLFANNASYRTEELQGAFWTLLLALVLIGGGLSLGWKNKQIYLFSYALIAAISCGLMVWMKIFKDTSEGLFVYMLYAIGGIFFIIKLVSTKSKDWKHGS